MCWGAAVGPAEPYLRSCTLQQLDQFWIALDEGNYALELLIQRIDSSEGARAIKCAG